MPSTVNYTPEFQLGDAVAKALAAVGVTKERVERWVGGPCGCLERQHKLNLVSSWAWGTLRHKFTDARTVFEEMLQS